MNTKFKIGNKVFDENGRMLEIIDVTDTSYLYGVVDSSVRGATLFASGDSRFKLIEEEDTKIMMHPHSSKSVYRNNNTTTVKIDPNYDLLEYSAMLRRIANKYLNTCGESIATAICSKEDEYNELYGEEIAEAKAWKQSKKKYLSFLKFMDSELEKLQGVIKSTIEKTQNDIEHNERFINKFKDGEF